MAGSLFGLGAGTPSRFPYEDRPQPAPGVSPGQSQVTRARIVIVFGPAGTVNGVFVYSPGTTPGPGNTPIAAITASAADPYGNSVQPGDASALGTIIAIGAAPSGGTHSYVQLAPGNPAAVNLGTGASSEASPGQALTQIIPFLTSQYLAAALVAPKVTGEAAGAFASVSAVSSRANLLDGPSVQIAATDGTSRSQLNVQVNGGVQIPEGNFISQAGTAAAPTLITTDTWHPATYAGTWQTAGADSLEYSLQADDSTWILGRISNTGNQVSGSVITTLPAGYFNSSRTTWGTCSIANSNTVMPMQLTTAGQLQILGAYTAGQALIINLKMPLGA